MDDVCFERERIEHVNLMSTFKGNTCNVGENMNGWRCGWIFLFKA